MSLSRSMPHSLGSYKQPLPKDTSPFFAYMALFFHQINTRIQLKWFYESTPRKWDKIHYSIFRVVHRTITSQSVRSLCVSHPNFPTFSSKICLLWALLSAVQCWRQLSLVKSSLHSLYNLHGAFWGFVNIGKISLRCLDETGLLQSRALLSFCWQSAQKWMKHIGWGSIRVM